MFVPASRPGRAATRRRHRPPLHQHPARAGRRAGAGIALQQANPGRRGSDGSTPSGVQGLLALPPADRGGPSFPPRRRLARRRGAPRPCLCVAIVVLAGRGPLRERPRRAPSPPRHDFPECLGRPSIASATPCCGGLGGLRRPGSAACAFGATVLSWLLLSPSAWLPAVGFDLGLGFGAGVPVVVANNLLMVLPSSPAAVGVYEAAVLLALSAYGIEESRALLRRRPARPERPAVRGAGMAGAPPGTPGGCGARGAALRPRGLRAEESALEGGPLRGLDECSTPGLTKNRVRATREEVGGEIEGPAA